MNIGYWKRGDREMRTHVLDPLDGAPGCHAFSTQWSADMVTFDGGLSHVDCRRCLVMERRRARERLAAIENRLQGRAGIQRDAFEVRR